MSGIPSAPAAREIDLSDRLATCYQGGGTVATEFDSSPAGHGQALSRRQVLRGAGASALALGGLGSLGGLAPAVGASRRAAAGNLNFVYLGTAQQQQQWNQLFRDFGK